MIRRILGSSAKSGNGWTIGPNCGPARLSDAWGFFGSNTGAQSAGYLLWFGQSIEELRIMGAELCDGLHVVLYSPHELEMEAFLKFDGSIVYWRGTPVPGATKHLDGSS
jgi:hypothetical protein